MANAVQEVQRLGQSIWYDNIRRGLIESGEIQKLIDLGVTGLTSNPTIFEKAIVGSTDYDSALLELAPDVKDAGEVFEALAMEDIRAAADLLRPVYDRTDGVDGYVSLEVNPHLARDTEGTTSEARRLFAALRRPNVMIKVPATAEGIPAVRSLIADGINVNVTLIFSRDVYRQVSEAYIMGLEDLDRAGGDVSKVASVASFFVSRVDTAIDDQLDALISEGREELLNLRGKAAVSNAKLAYRLFQDKFGERPFTGLRAKGARVQRPLWASTGTKNAANSDVLYLDSLIGPDTVNTVPEATLMAFLDHGGTAETLVQGVEAAEVAIQSLEQAGIQMEQVTARLLADGLKSFSDSYDTLLANIEEKRARLLAQAVEHPGASLGTHLEAVKAVLEELQRREVVRGIWRKDHTVWKPDPEEITNRLGWLTVIDTMREQVPSLKAFAKGVVDAGIRHVVLLGMGGSSLGPEVLRRTFGSAEGYPELLVLDSTVPAWVRSVTDAVDPAKTLFLVSSKSGGTVEPNTLYTHFRAQVDRAVGEDDAGQSFVAITDPGTSLETLARDSGFRRVFANPPEIGGRYSVLSYFGLVPAALMGIDIEALLDRADRMRERCASEVGAQDSPGAWLGALMSAVGSNGRDKLTLVTSPCIGSFGLWVEQLIAESLGKEGGGIVPVAGEPLLTPASYGDDRFFVYLRVGKDDNDGTDAVVEGIESSGQPVVRLDLRDVYDLGAEFFRWEFATAVAGAVIGVNPFDQPDVQAAKDRTDAVLQEFQSSGALPALEPTASLGELLSAAGPGDYLAIMAYIHGTTQADRALQDFRREVTERYAIPTTLGYGPRFLHSTGQLHKGGPASGIYLQLTADVDADVEIPGELYTFAVLADAQALGDLRALQSSGRRVARVHLGAEPSVAIRGLHHQLTH